MSTNRCDTSLWSGADTSLWTIVTSTQLLHSFKEKKEVQDKLRSSVLQECDEMAHAFSFSSIEKTRITDLFTKNIFDLSKIQDENINIHNEMYGTRLTKSKIRQIILLKDKIIASKIKKHRHAITGIGSRVSNQKICAREETFYFMIRSATGRNHVF